MQGRNALSIETASKGGLYGNVLRLSPPLNISKADVGEAVRILDEAFAAVQPRVAASRSAR